MGGAVDRAQGRGGFLTWGGAESPEKPGVAGGMRMYVWINAWVWEMLWESYLPDLYFFPNFKDAPNLITQTLWKLEDISTPQTWCFCNGTWLSQGKIWGWGVGRKSILGPPDWFCPENEATFTFTQEIF